MHESQEEWRAIPDFCGYEASSLGRIRSWWRHGPVKGFMESPRLLKPCTAAKYHHVTLYRDGIAHTVPCHGAVLAAFRGRCPPGHEGAHDNGIRADNRLANLFWKTHEENEADKQRHGTVARGPTHMSVTKPWTVARGDRNGARSKPERLPRGSKHGMAKLDERKVGEIKAMLADGRLRHREIAALFGVSKVTVGDIGRGRIWRHVA